ncbi:MAG: hypothetical protein C4344_03595 [Acidimicrobiia bacterium]
MRVFDHLLGLSLDFYGREPAGRLVARMTSDIDALTELVQTGLVLFVTNGLLLLGSVAAVVALSPRLAAVCLVGLPVVVAASVRFRRSSNRAYLVYRDRIAQTMSSLQEGLRGVRVIQAFAREDDAEARFVRRNRAQLAANMDTARVSAYYFPVIELAGVATTAVAVGIGGLFVHRGDVSVGTVAAFVLYLGNLFEPVQQLSQLFNTLQSAGAALTKLFGLLDEAPSLTERPGAVDLPARGRLVAEGVRFSYDGGTPVLDGVDLVIEPGEHVALVGPTGAGKSTLAKLLARFYDPDAGRVSFGGVDLRDATLRSSGSSWCPRRAFCSRERYGTTSGWCAPTPPTPRSRRRCARSGSLSTSPASLRASTPRCASAGRNFRPANVSWCPSPGRRSRTPRYSFSTKRRPISIRARKPRSRRRWRPSWRAAPLS